MVTNTVRIIQDTNQRCCSHCNKVHTNTPSSDIRKNKAPHCKSDRQSPTNLNSPRCHCQDVSNTASTTSGPSDATDINICLKPETASNTSHQQVSHLATHNTVASLETHLITDTTIDGQTEFHTMLQVTTSQGCKPLHVKVDPGAESSLFPLSHFCHAFPKHFTKSGALKKAALIPMWQTWSAHDGTCQSFLGYIMLNIQHKTLHQTLLIKFFIFEDATSPTHPVILSSFIKIRHSAVHNSKQNTCKFSVSD